jgi:hypothetical protein
LAGQAFREDRTGITRTDDEIVPGFGLQNVKWVGMEFTREA